MAHVVTQSCCNDASCVSVCPVDCIHPTPAERAYIRTEMLFIDPVACIDCGACVDECPVDAIVPPEDLTPETEVFAAINAAYYEDITPDVVEEVAKAPVAAVSVGAARDPLRVAIVGSGPSACYVAEELSSSAGIDVEVTILERLPTPGGLVRYGVAPDHAKTKLISTAFSRTLSRKNCAVLLNVDVGQHLSHDEVLAHHHAVVYASGAPADRSLGIPGEDLPGSVSAREFSAWYNGHPDHVERKFDFSGERAVVVGNGNVALDVARVLTSDVARLVGTDIADHALESLAASRIREVIVLGRRGVGGAAFSTPELLGLSQIPGVEVTASGFEQGEPESRALHRIKASMVDNYGRTIPSSGTRRIHLQFHRTPVSFFGDGRVSGIRVERNTVHSPGGEPVVVGTGEFENIEAGLLVRSIGFRGVRIAGLPFDELRGVLPNQGGAVVDPSTGEPVAGVYTAGWLKRGPSGVIGSNRPCSIETSQHIVRDYLEGRLEAPRHSTADFMELVGSRQPELVDLKGWKKIDAHERKQGKVHGRPRLKIVDVAEMVDVARGMARVAR
ncbi:FAD-dependent oxidoreductase [Rhodococcus sp. IEGM 1366]|uniref:FAD-dependent oxidoreductase n=1 Tax=Rhodococcus sp. IEGM 1366 TaxID=3082223 RepID=UPI002954A581|nr:FAD-dependent oxidoreductase [Rhodococcus sp. IEGM 1366]MDV8068517.1 FAD-dependent oxidoreductase [Rhodococcus sp. IEGM 1366]